MQILAVGNSSQRHRAALLVRYNARQLAYGVGTTRLQRSYGFTLLELLVVLSIVAMTTAIVTLSFRENPQAILERDALRLVGLLESARAQSRASATPVFWRAAPDGFQFEGLLPAPSPDKWLRADTSVIGNASLQLGPESFIGAQTLRLSSTKESPSQSGGTLEITTDGLRPFHVQAAAQQ